MSNQACPGVPVVAIGKGELTSVSGGYGAADMFSNNRINAIRERTCQGCAFDWRAFFNVIPFLSY